MLGIATGQNPKNPNSIKKSKINVNIVQGKIKHGLPLKHPLKNTDIKLIIKIIINTINFLQSGFKNCLIFILASLKYFLVSLSLFLSQPC